MSYKLYETVHNSLEKKKTISSNKYFFFKCVCCAKENSSRICAPVYENYRLISQTKTLLNIE